MIGLALGGGLAFVLEYFDPSLRSEEAFRLAFPDVPLLVAIPVVPGADETINKKTKTEKLEIRKYNPALRRHTLHKEIK